MLAFVLASAMIAVPDRQEPAPEARVQRMCPYLPQFHENAEVAKYVERVKEDGREIANMLETYGAWQDCEFGEWRGVPFTAERYRLRWIENQKIKKAWDLLDWATWEEDLWPPGRRQEYIEQLRAEIGDDWFNRAVMPCPLSLRDRIPLVAPRPVR
jgi:hypothetical protein